MAPSGLSLAGDEIAALACRALVAVTEATIICPECGHASTETMPTDSCRFFYTCGGCGATLRPKAGDCCVFCSFSEHVCPPKQADQASCC